MIFTCDFRLSIFLATNNVDKTKILKISQVFAKIGSNTLFSEFLVFFYVLTHIFPDVGTGVVYTDFGEMFMVKPL